MVNKWGFIVGCVLAFATVWAVMEYTGVQADAKILTYPNTNITGVLTTDLFCHWYWDNVTSYLLQYSLNGGSWVNVSENRRGMAKLPLTNFADGDKIDIQCLARYDDTETQVIDDYGTIYVNNSGYYFTVLQNGFDFRVKELTKPYSVYRLHVPYNNLSVKNTYVDCGADGMVEYLFNESSNDITRNYACLISRYTNVVGIGYIIERDNTTIQFPESACDSTGQELECLVQMEIKYEVYN